MEHEYWEERLQGYIDNELDPADHTAVEQHIASCEGCKAQARYFCAMKKRVRAHTSSVEMPLAVADRLNLIFEKKRNPFRRRLFPVIGAGLAIAAALVLFLLLPRQGYLFKEGSLSGQIKCHDCHLADLAQLTKGDLCKDGHLMGLVAGDGTLWRIAADDIGIAFLRDMSLFGKEVDISGSLLKQEHLIRIHELKLADQRQAAL